MSPSSPLLPARRVLVAALGAALAAALVACAPGDAEPAEPTDTGIATPSTEPEPSDTPDAEPSVDPAAAAAATIETAMSTGDTSPLVDLLADPTRVVIAASEADSPHTPVDAVLALDYVQPGVGFWDFALDEAIIAVYRGNPYYGAYFPEGVVTGRSNTGALVAFVPAGGTFSTIFMSIDENLVTSY